MRSTAQKPSCHRDLFEEPDELQNANAGSVWGISSRGPRFSVGICVLQVVNSMRRLEESRIYKDPWVQVLS